MTVADYLAKFPFTDDAREAVSETFDTEDAFNDAVLSRAVERVRNGVDKKTTRPQDETDLSAEINLISYPMARILVSLLDDNRIISRYAESEAKTAINYIDESESESQQELSEFYTKATLTLEDMCEEYDIDIIEHTQEDITAILGDEVFETLTTEQKELLLEQINVNSNAIDLSADSQEVLRQIAKRTELSRSESLYEIPVESYVQASAKLDGPANSLSNMPLKDGKVYIPYETLLSLLEKLIYADIMDGLPIDVPEEIRDSIQVQDAVDVIRHSIDEQYFTFEIDQVEEDQFPPCMEVLLERTRKGEHLEHNARFALASFLVNIGMTTDEILELFGGVPDFAEDTTRYQINHIRGDVGSTEYTSPSCATMVTQGLCVNKDDLCEHINHPLSYYRIRLQDYGDAEELADGDDSSESEDEASEE